MKTFSLDIGFKRDTISTNFKISGLRLVVQAAADRGVKPFDDGYYHGWINPIMMRDLLNDATFNEFVDVIYLDKSPEGELQSIRMCGVKFLETVAVNNIYIFGSNSDPLELETWVWNYVE